MAEDETLALIPALHSDGKESSASLQIITNDKAFSISYPKIRFNEDKFRIKIGQNYFSKKGICLNIETNNYSIHGKLRFGIFHKIKYSIMGPFRYIPFMQCKHNVISMRHVVTGTIKINDKVYCFNEGIGYIEGDCGCSFPKEYIWTQCHFPNGSIMLSVADIPMLGFHFRGIIGIVMIAGKEYRIATYLGARVSLISDDTVVIKQGKYTLYAKLIESKHQKLNAPVCGKMTRIIHESASCKARYLFICEDKILLDFTSENASFEYEFK
ncbi:tocopherol cyclase family protein [Anaerosporobacter sp.]|uniref:tocopherol cyclase family protein n=1 Tax=Anaerosporobacter sp. TaxID=1872529 RepID=UPI00286F6CCE|nr:tocopherol cyclase family protein [Anaerosporobacter sp.]